MGNRSQKRRVLPRLLLAGVGIGLFVRQLTRFELTSHVIESPGLPPSFDGFRIIHISDLHNNRLVCRNRRFLEKIRESAPDAAVITGDIADGTRTHLDTAVNFVSGLAKVCPVYYVPGNHEARIPEREILFHRLGGAGAALLFNRTRTVTRGSDSIIFAGVTDPAFRPHGAKNASEYRRLAKRLQSLPRPDKGRFGILLSHRPEYFGLYAETGYDLVFAGHAHGGQWRVPPFGALYAPGQGLLPEYTSGVYSLAGANMVVSRGLGNSKFPLRVNNPFELVLVTLKRSGAAG